MMNIWGIDNITHKFAKAGSQVILFFQNLPDVEGAPQIFSETGVFLEFLCLTVSY